MIYYNIASFLFDCLCKKVEQVMFRQVVNRLKKLYQKHISDCYLPCTVFCRNPLVLATFEQEFLKNSQAFLDCFSKSRAKTIHVFLQFGWEHETPENSEPLVRALKDILAQCSRLSITLLANSENEVRVLSRLGIHTVLCNHNAFVDETRYPILRLPKQYDAVYIARITPFKRHFLASQIRSLHLIGHPAWKAKEVSYTEEVVHHQLKHAVWSSHVDVKMIPAEIAKARCGLCLSKAEGAMFASIEYLLCGIPVVNTPSLGGRDVMFPDFAVKTVPDTPGAVAEAVQEFVEHAPEPEKIRAAALEKMKVHRGVFRQLLNDAMMPKSFPDSRPFPHKLILRCTKTPLQLLRYGLRKPKR